MPFDGTLKSLYASFAGGEVSPYMYARADFAKFHVACRTLLNCFVHPQGGASNRAGTLFVGEVDDSSVCHRLIPFQFRSLPTGQTYALVFGNFTMQVVMNNGAGQIGFVQCPTQPITGATQANPCVLTIANHGFTTGTILPLAAIGGMTQLNGTNPTITVVDANHVSLNGVNSTGYGAYTSGGTAGGGDYTLASPYAAADLQVVKYVATADKMTLTHPGYAPQLLTRTGHAAWTFSPMLFVPQTASPTGLVSTSPGTAAWVVVTAINDATGEESLPTEPAGSSSATAGAWNWGNVAGCSNYNVYLQSGSIFAFVAQVQAPTWTDNNIAGDVGTTPPGARNPFAVGSVQSMTGTGGTGYAQNDAVTMNSTTGSGFEGYVNINTGTGAVISVTIIDPGSGYKSTDTASVTTAGASGATLTPNVGPSSGTWPGCTGFYQQRQGFGNTTNSPETLWFTVAGTTTNMNVSTPTQDSDAITRTLSSEQVNEIRHLVPVGTSMLALTSGAEFRVWPGPSNSSFTPGTCTTLPQTALGSSHVKPFYTENVLLLVQERGSGVQGLKYDVLQDLYTPQDFSVLATHLLSDTGGNYQIQEWAFAQTPFRVAWSVRSDGTMLGFTFMKEQDVYAWHRHQTQGLYESVCSVMEPDGFGGYFDAVYFIVNRTVGGVTRRYVERQAPRVFPQPSDMWFVDCGLQYDGWNSSGHTLAISGATYNPGDTVTLAATGFTPATGTYYQLEGADGQSVIVQATGPTGATVYGPQAAPASVQNVAVTNWATMATAISGLDHLDGFSVAILGDGSVVPGQTVVNGSVALDGPYAVVTAGLPYTSALETLNLAVEVNPAQGQGSMKKIAQITVRLKDTRGAEVGIAENDINGNDTQTYTEAKQPMSARTLGTVEQLYNGDFQMVVPSDWNRDGRMFVQQQYPLPMTVLGLVPTLKVGN